MGYTLSDVRQWARSYARNAKDSTEYSDWQIDSAIQAACNAFLLDTRFSYAIHTVALTTGNETLDTGTVSGMETFRPDMLLRVWLTGSNVHAGLPSSSGWTRPFFTEGGWTGVWDETVCYLNRCEYLDLYNARIAENRRAQPAAIGFKDRHNAMVYPVPDNAYTLNLAWSPPFLAATGTWTQGMADGSTVTDFNIPDDVLQQILVWGIPAFLQHAEAEHAYATASGQKFAEFVRKMAGRGGPAPRRRSVKQKRWFG